MAKQVVKYRNRYVRGKRRGHRRGFSIPLAAVAGLMPLAGYTYTNVVGGSFMGQSLPAQGVVKGITGSLSVNLLGYDQNTGKWALDKPLKFGWGPILLGYIVHKLAGKLGVNRALAQAGIPVFRV